MHRRFFLLFPSCFFAKLSFISRKISHVKQYNTWRLNKEFSTQKFLIFQAGLCENTGACDKNAYCKEYPERFSFGCTCKQGYYGFGFNGNCKKIIDTGMSKILIFNLITIYFVYKFLMYCFFF